MPEYTIQRHENNPYGGIIIKRGFSTVIQFPMDDAPVHDFNMNQNNLAFKILNYLNTQEPVDNNMAGDLDRVDIDIDAWSNPNVPTTLLEKVQDEIWQTAPATMNNPQKAHFVGERLKEMTPFQLLQYISSAIE
jgi:hypothetical protein